MMRRQWRMVEMDIVGEETVTVVMGGVEGLVQVR